MNSRSLSRLVRLRRLQDDAAKANLLRANASRADAEMERIRRTEALTALRLPERADAASWLAVTASRQSAALAIRDSIEVLRHSAVQAQAATDEWTKARTALRGFERLEEMRAEVERARELALEQREQDDRSASRAHDEVER
jgi:hypothetical protein